MVYFCGKRGKSVEVLRELEQSFKNVSRVKRVIELVQNAKTSEEIKLAFILLVPSLSLDNLLFDTDDLEEIRCSILKSLKDKLSQINNGMEVVDMSNISQQFSTIRSEVQHFKKVVNMDNYNEISTKFYNIEKLFKDIRNTKDTIEGTQKLLDDIMHHKTIYKLDIFMGIGETKTITDCEDLWKQIQQYVVVDLQNKLEKAKQKYKELCKQYEVKLNKPTIYKFIGGG